MSHPVRADIEFDVAGGVEESTVPIPHWLTNHTC